MLYCERCRRLYDPPCCPRCRRDRGRAVRPDDLCLAAEKPALWAGMLEDVFRQQGIPFLKQGRLGAGLATAFGPMLETMRFYVPYACLEEAQALTESLFPEAEDVTVLPPDGECGAQALPDDEEP